MDRKAEPSNVDLTKLKESLWRSAVQQDIRSVFDVTRYTFASYDDFYGRLSVVISVFATFHGSFDCYMMLEIRLCTNKNQSYQLLMNLKDVRTHVAKDVERLIRNKEGFIKALQSFVAHVQFIRSRIYHKPCLLYFENRGERLRSIHTNNLRCSTSWDKCLEHKYEECEVVGQYFKRFDRRYCLVTVFKHLIFKQFSVELYFAGTNKRFTFELFNDELLVLDKEVLRDVFETSSLELVQHLQTAGCNYCLFKQALAALGRRKKGAAPDTTNDYVPPEKLIITFKSFRLDLPKYLENSTKAKEKCSTKIKELLMIHQWEKLVENLKISYNGSNQPIVSLGRFKAGLRETLLKYFGYSTRDNCYWFEIILTLSGYGKQTTWTLPKYLPVDRLLEMDILFKVKFIGTGKFQNDKIKMKELLNLFPGIKQRVENNDIKYSDFLKIAEDMYFNYQRNYKKRELREKCPETNQISYIAYNSQIKILPKLTSALKYTRQQIVFHEFPLLLYRKPFSASPLRLMVIMVLDTETIQILIMNLKEATIYEKHLKICEIEKYIPFVRKLLNNECSSELGKRIYKAYKNQILIDMSLKDHS